MTGALYLLAVWLWFGGDRLLPENHPKNDAMERIQELADLLGPTATAAAVGLGAYLLGSVATIKARTTSVLALEHTGGKSDRAFWPWYFDVLWLQAPDAGVFGWLWATYSDRARNADLESTVNNRVAKVANRSLRHPEEDLHEGETIDERKNDQAQALLGAVLELLPEEYESLAVRMQIQRPELYSEYDRLQSEAELRLSIAPPLAVVVGVLAVTASLWWVLGLALVYVLVREGAKARLAAEMLVWQAMRSGVVESTVVGDLGNLPWPSKVRRNHGGE